jgi:hypothetical protein
LIPPGGLPAAYQSFVASDLIRICSGVSLYLFFLTDSEIFLRVSSDLGIPKAALGLDSLASFIFLMPSGFGTPLF